MVDDEEREDGPKGFGMLRQLLNASPRDMTEISHELDEDAAEVVNTEVGNGLSREDSGSDADSRQGSPEQGSPEQRSPRQGSPRQGSTKGILSTDLPRVIAVANQKGGVGKTTTTVNLGACLADLGYRTVIVDLDPQGNATTALGNNPHELEMSMYDVILGDTPLTECLVETEVANLILAPASLDLAGAEIELVPVFSRELRLKRALEPILSDHDYILIDCPPSLGLLTVNALAAATEVMVPIQCEYFALEGLGQLVRNIDLVRQGLNPALEVGSIVLVMYDARTKLSEQVADQVREHFGSKVVQHVVPRTVRLSEAPSFGQPITIFDPNSRGAIAYREIAKEVSGGPSKRSRQGS